MRLFYKGLSHTNWNAMFQYKHRRAVLHKAIMKRFGHFHLLRE